MGTPKPGGKRTPGTSVETIVQAMADAAAGPLEPPAHVKLRDGDAPFWAGIVCARARSDWPAVDLVVAAQLARCQADIERESMALDDESTVLTNARGTQVANPRVMVLEQLARREMALLRTLRMGGRAAGDPRDDAGRRKAQADAAAIRESLEDEELLAS
jgi:hypothetical protein